MTSCKRVYRAMPNGPGPMAQLASLVPVALDPLVPVSLGPLAPWPWTPRWPRGLGPSGPVPLDPLAPCPWTPRWPSDLGPRWPVDLGPAGPVTLGPLALSPWAHWPIDLVDPCGLLEWPSVGLFAGPASLSVPRRAASVRPFVGRGPVR
jgi:hypothetical protein